MIIESVKVAGLGPIKDFECQFVHGGDNQLNGHNVNLFGIVGINGCGKSFLLDAIATIAGNDSATELLADSPIGEIELAVKVNDASLTFTANKSLDRGAIAEFKAKLGPNRVNYGLTQHRCEKFITGQLDAQIAQKRLSEYFKWAGQPKVFRLGNYCSSMPVGDGTRRAITLILLSSMSGGPLLLDLPETHMDVRARYQISEVLAKSSRQVIAASHCPEFISGFGSVISF